MSYETDYVRKHLGEPLTLALTEICLKRPKDPMAYLAQWLLHYQRIKGRHRPSKEEQRFEEVVASPQESNAGFAKMDDFWYEGHKPEMTKGETELGYPFSLVAGDAEDTVSLERRKIEKMVREMVGQEVARFVQRASSREGSTHSLEEMLKEQIFKRISEETERAVPKEALESLKPGYRALAMDYLDELLNEENLQRVIEDKVGRNVLKEGNSFERMIKEEVLRRIFGDSRPSLASASKDEDDVIWKVVSSGIGEGNSDFDLEVEVDGSKGSSEELSTLALMLKEEIARIIRTTKRQESGDLASERDRDGAERGDVEGKRNSLEEMLKYDIIQKINTARVEKISSGVSLEYEGAKDKIERGDEEVKRNSLEGMLKDEIIQKIIATGVAKTIPEVKLASGSADDGIEQASKEVQRNSLEEMLKDQIIQRVIADRMRYSAMEVNLQSGIAEDELKQGHEELEINSLEEMLKKEIIPKLVAAGLGENGSEGNLESREKLEQGREKTGVSLVDVLKDQIIQKLMSAVEQDLGLANLANEDVTCSKTNSFEDNLKEQILQRLNASRSGVSDAKKAEVEGISLEEALKEQIYQSVVALQNGSPVNKMAGFVTHKHREGSDVDEPSLEEDIKTQIFGRMLADEGDSIEEGIGVKANAGKSLERKEGSLERKVKVGAANSNEGEGRNTVRKDKGAALVRIIVTKEDETQTDDEKQTETDSSQPIPHLHLTVEDEDIIPV